MKTHTVITHAMSQGVSLRRAGDPVSLVRRPRGPVMIGNESWVSLVPRGELRQMISEALGRGQYAYASGLSGMLHTPVAEADLPMYRTLLRAEGYLPADDHVECQRDRTGACD